MTFRFIGKSLPRTEDLRLVRGLGRYTADLAPTDALRLYILRSPHAAARIRSIDAGAAQSMPGVQLVLTGDDPELLSLGVIPSKVKRKAPDGTPNFEPPYRMLAQERALFVGDAVAAVFAETLNQAKDAAEAIVIDYEALPSVTDTKRAPRSAARTLRARMQASPNRLAPYRWRSASSSRRMVRISGADIIASDSPRLERINVSGAPAGAPEKDSSARR